MTTNIGFDGVALEAAREHPSIGGGQVDYPHASIATDGNDVGVLANTDKTCKLLTMNEAGRDQTTWTSDWSSRYCFSLGSVRQKTWSWLLAPRDNEAYVFQTIENGALTVSQQIRGIPEGRIVWADGSFLVTNFQGQDLDPFLPLTSFDASGNEIVPSRDPVKVAFPFSSVVATQHGALALALDINYVLAAVPIDHRGVATGGIQPITAGETIVDSLFLGLPNDDAFLAMLKEEGDDHTQSTTLVALSPRGVPLGPTTLASRELSQKYLYGAADSTGSHVILVSEADEGIVAQPFTCVTQ